MNQNVFYPNRNTAAPPQLQFCFKCRWEGRTPMPVCPRCRRGLFSQTNVRWRGVALTFLGIFFTGFISAITFFVTVLLAAPAKAPRNNVQIRNDELLFLLICIVFGSLIACGITATIGGIWQAVFGRRNMFLMWICGAFLVLAFFAGTVFRGLAE